MADIIVIAGPTASGKSHFALTLAEKYAPAVIINADSMQLYRELPILTAHPSVEDKARYQHALYGIYPATTPCSVAMWLDNAHREIDHALTQGVTPIIVGGTGMYLKSLMQGIAHIPEVPLSVRNEMTALHQQLGASAFYEELAKCDPEIAASLHPHDTQRVIRAYSVMQHTGKSLRYWQQQPVTSHYAQDRFAYYALFPERETLYQRCNQRFDQMIAMGAIEEVASLQDYNLTQEHPALKALGVRELLAYLAGKLTLTEAGDKAKQATRNYAKRQVTWFKNQFATLDNLYTP